MTDSSLIKGLWWKLLALLLLLYAVIYGFFIEVPYFEVTKESIRNVFYHVGMWFGMSAMLITSFIFSIRYLRGFREKEDIVAVEAANVGIFFGILGLITGMIWAKSTWGAFWVRDPKLDGAAVGMFIYLAYMVLRGSINDIHKRAKVSAVFNIFAFILWIVFVMVLPRLAGSTIHPGQDGAPVMALNLSGSTRIVFYPAMIGWILLGFWIMNLRIRIKRLGIRD
ncbi:MAG: cytochrome c biogenesis protein CcsA [Bacteroidales bacterium]|nr:cytochrome c biogenesis protein CcsA [Bacteroidales bacterium]